MASNFEGEVFAILLALERLAERDDPNIVILVDSQAAIIAVTSNTETDLAAVLSCRQLIHKICNRSANLHFQWCPSHCGIVGNERADTLAKEGSNMLQPQRPLAFSSAKKFINGRLKEWAKTYFETASEGKAWEPLLSNPIPITLQRKEGVACFRMQTGHDYLAKHLHRIGVLPSPTCLLCNIEDMTALHLQTCPSLGDVNFNSDDSNWAKLSKLYWAARYRMAELPTVGVG